MKTIKHNMTLAEDASQSLYANLLDKGMVGGYRVNPTTFVCQSTDEHGSQTCYMINSDGTMHTINPIAPFIYTGITGFGLGTGRSDDDKDDDEGNEGGNGSEGGGISEEDMLLPPKDDDEDDDDDKCCPACGTVLNLTSQTIAPNPIDAVANNPSVPDDVEIVAIVRPQDIYGHLTDEELFEAYMKRSAHTTVKHPFATKERAIKEVAVVMTKKHGGSFQQTSHDRGVHVAKNGQINRIIAEDNCYRITSMKI